MARMDEYADTPGFCKSATLEKIRAEGHILAPGRYVDPEAAEIDSEPFEEKMQRLVAQLQVQTQRARIIDDTITSNLRELGFGE
jgi:type I restriction enzyme M protein